MLLSSHLNNFENYFLLILKKPMNQRTRVIVKTFFYKYLLPTARPFQLSKMWAKCRQHKCPGSPVNNLSYAFITDQRSVSKIRNPKLNILHYQMLRQGQCEAWALIIITIRNSIYANRLVRTFKIIKTKTPALFIIIIIIAIREPPLLNKGLERHEER